MKRYSYSYQCPKCYIKSGYGFVGTEADVQMVPTCCGGERMVVLRGNEIPLESISATADIRNMEGLPPSK